MSTEYCSLVDFWITEYARDYMVSCLDVCGLDGMNEFGAVVQKAVSGRSEQVSRDELLIRFMYYVCTGKNVVSEGGLTPLEHALTALRSLEPLCTDDVSQLTHTLTSLIKQQAVIVCCRQKKWSLARQVFDRVWRTTAADDDNVRVKMAAMLDSRDEDDVIGDDDVKTLLNAARQLVARLCSHLSKSHLTRLATHQLSAAAAASLTADEVPLTHDEWSSVVNIQPTNIVLDGAEAMCVVKALIDSSPVLDESRGLSLLDETQHESLLKCLMCWQRQYGPCQVVMDAAAAAAACNPCEESIEEESIEESVVCPSQRSVRADTRRPQTSGVSRKKRSHWSASEEQQVYLAVQRHGVGNWSAVISEGGLAAWRTSVDIKDKWRTMAKQGRLAELSAKFGPVTRHTKHCQPH